MREYFIFGLLALMFICLGIVGIRLWETYHPNIIEDCSTQVKINGLWLTEVKELGNYAGSWICINIENVKTLTELERVCRHEIGHEIFARECESNFTKCVEIVK